MNIQVKTYKYKPLKINLLLGIIISLLYSLSDLCLRISAYSLIYRNKALII